MITVSGIMPNLRETQRSNSKKTPGQAAQQKDGQTIFHRTILAIAGSPTSTNTVPLHLKAKDIE